MSGPLQRLRLMPNGHDAAKRMYNVEGVLAEYRRIDSQRLHWEDHWRRSSVPDVLGRAKQVGALGEFEAPFMRHLPRSGLILEAGCGTGKYVAALQARGFPIEGLDFARETISRVRAADPSLDVSVGDITAIDRPDSHYTGYISIGVVEHFFGGPDVCLDEAFRVLKPGGIALISVPFLNSPRRKTLARLSPIEFEVDGSGFRFYQYYFAGEDFSHRLRRAGFVVNEVWPYLVFGGLIRDWALGGWLNRRSFLSHRLRSVVRRACAAAPRPIQSRFAHMVLFVCRKPHAPQSGLLPEDAPNKWPS